MALTGIHPQIFVGDDRPTEGELSTLLKEHGTKVVVGHPTYGNATTIGKLVSHGIEAAARHPSRPTAIVISDGTGPAEGNPVLQAALDAAEQTLDVLDQDVPVTIVGLTYDGYRGDHTPGKGSALKLLFDEALAAGVETLLLADGDLRNDVGQWRDVYERLHKHHRASHPDAPYFVTARYARHFVDASLTRFIVGPLTTLLGTYVPGGISGDIALSAGALELEAGADWTEARRKYGTDISTTMDNIASGTTIYELYLGAKLHDVTDEARLSVMPGEVIGAALERLRHWESQAGLVSRSLAPDAKLTEVRRWGPEITGIDFIDPGATDVFDMDTKLNSLATRHRDYADDLADVLSGADALELETRVALLANARRTDEAPIPTLGITVARWIDWLQDGVAHALTHDDIGPATRALNYLYTGAFQEFVRQRLHVLGLTSLGRLRRVQEDLAVPETLARTFYEAEVDDVADDLARRFFAARGRLARLLAGART